MPYEEKITCDHCGRDLTATGNCVDYRLALLNQNIAPRGEVVTAMMKYPPIENDVYFCGVQCLVAWVQKNYIQPSTVSVPKGG